MDRRDCSIGMGVNSHSLNTTDDAVVLVGRSLSDIDSSNII